MTNEIAIQPKAKEFVFIGRCVRKGCVVTFQKTIPGRLVTKWTRGFVGVPGSATSFKASEPVWPSEMQCPEHNCRISWAMVKGIKTEHVCDARCTSARGHNCECSCGGKNHGRDFSI